MVQEKESATAPDREIYAEFKKLVNMQARTLERWLESDESRGVGIKRARSTEAVGHRSGRSIVELLRTKRSEYTVADYRQMHRVVGYIRRHLAQRPSGDVSQTRWAYSLKNWGHDPAKR